MLVLTRKINEKLVLPDLNTTIQILAVKANSVRLGIDAPREIRILREEVPDRVAEWGAPDEEARPASMDLLQWNQLLQKRLEITRHGLTELRQQLDLGNTNDFDSALERLDEDLDLLQRRIQTEAVTS